MQAAEQILKMKKNKNIPYYLVAIGLFILLKVGFSFADNNALILNPTDKLVGFVNGSQSVYLADLGFYHEKMNIVIEKSCSGFNFLILSFLLFVYLGLKYLDKRSHKNLAIPVALLCAYCFTVFVNASRIIASIVVRNQTVGIFPEKQSLIHEIVGITTNFSFLVVAYYLSEKFLIHRKYAKLT